MFLQLECLLYLWPLRQGLSTLTSALALTHMHTHTHTQSLGWCTNTTYFFCDILVILLKIRQRCNYALSHALTCTFTYKESVDFCPLVWCQSQSLSPLRFPISLPSSCFSLHSPRRSSWWIKKLHYQRDCMRTLVLFHLSRPNIGMWLFVMFHLFSL